MLIKFSDYIKEEIDWWENGKLVENPEEDDIDDTPVDSDYYKRFNNGMKVICIKDCQRTHTGRDCPIKRGDIKIITGISSGHVWFTDTPDGYGAYEKSNFRIYEDK